MDTANHNEELFEGCLRGDRKAQRALYERYSPSLYALCLRFVGDPETARDVLAESFTKIFRSMQSRRKDGSLEAWMRTITIHCACQQRQRILASPEVPMPDNLQLPPDHRTPEAHLSTRVALDDGLSRLSPEQRMVFNLVAVEGYFFTDIPRLTGIAVHTAKRLYAKAKEIMKETLIEHEITL